MNWYYESNGLQQGPVSESELRQLITLGRISKHNLLWRNGMHDWTPLGEVEDLSPHPHSAGATALAHTPDAETSAGTADDLQKENSPGAANKYFVKALRIYPWLPKLWAAFALNFARLLR